jgi:signal transduction histidine kinase
MEDLMSHTEFGTQAENDRLPVVAGAVAVRALQSRVPDDVQGAAHGTVHDLGNLIQVAASALNILSRNPYLEGDPSLPPILASAMMSLARAGSLVEQTLRLAREGGTPVEKVCVSECLVELKALVTGAWQPQIELELRIEPSLPMLTCSRIDLQGAVMNLLTNAREAMPNGGTISLTARSVEEGGCATAVEIEVLDRGLGMSRDTLKRAFDPFFTTRTTGLGGFGLSAVQRFVDDAGGRIAINSGLNAGTRVILHLPIQDVQMITFGGESVLQQAGQIAVCQP